MRTSVRSLSREAEVRATLMSAGASNLDKLSFVAADLMNDAGWAEAVAGCTYVLHVASPFPPAAPKDENELIIPARDGALRVLKAARDAGVKRVVLTSSYAAIGYGKKAAGGAVDTEADWTDPNGADVRAYVKSKTIAERAAWDFIAREGGALELSVVNPVGVFGPVLGLGLFHLDPARAAADGWGDARLPEAQFRHCRRARCRRSALARNDQSRRQG